MLSSVECKIYHNFSKNKASDADNKCINYLKNILFWIYFFNNKCIFRIISENINGKSGLLFEAISVENKHWKYIVNKLSSRYILWYYTEIQGLVSPTKCFIENKLTYKFIDETNILASLTKLSHMRNISSIRPVMWKHFEPVRSVAKTSTKLWLFSLKVKIPTWKN